MKTKDFQEIYNLVFRDPEKWTKWFFGEVANDERQIYIAREDNGRASAVLLMQPYSFIYSGAELPSEYMSCVATRPEARSHGVASRLIKDTLMDAYSRGVAMCELIPAESHLFYFYKRFGFAPVFFVDRFRFTALHHFRADTCELVEPTYEVFSRLEREIGCGIVHSERDFANALQDLKLDGGYAIAARNPVDGAEAVVFADERDGVAWVKCIMADDDTAASAALEELRRRVGKKAMVVNSPAFYDDPAFLTAYGMGRIVDPQAVLQALAAANPKLNMAVRVRDGVIQENNGVFTVRNGECRRPDAFGGHLDLDVSVETLTALLFSSKKIASIFDLPAQRPYMTLMLD